MSRIAKSISDGDVQLWEPRTGQRIGSPRPHTATVTAIALSPCNLYAATGTDTGVLRLWNLPDWRQVGKPMSYDAEVSAVTFSTDSKLLAAAARDGVLRLWHAATQTPIGSRVSHGDAVSSVKFAPDGASFYTASRDYHLRRVQLCLPWQGDAKAVLRRAELVAGLGFDTDEAIAPLTEEP